MQTFIDFLADNYLWFLIISLILIFALIGYLVDTNEKKQQEKQKNSLGGGIPTIENEMEISPKEEKNIMANNVLPQENNTINQNTVVGTTELLDENE